MEAMARKRMLDIPTLGDNGIKLDERPVVDVDDATEYFLQIYRCPQASIVAEGLLNFDEILSESNFDQLSDENQKEIKDRFVSSRIPPPDKNESRSTIEMKFYERRYRIADHDARFKHAQRISRDARNVNVAKETRWSTIVKNHLFGSLIRSARMAERIRIYDPKEIVQSVKIEDEDIWHQGYVALKRTTPESATPLTIPKADLYIALPIIRRASNSRGFHKDDYIQNFTVDSLARLAEGKHGGLISNPIARLDTLKEVKENHLVCFPATVIELKHHAVGKKEKNKCYCQAANAASTALAMLNRLSLHSIPEKSFGEIRPVVAFTFIGYESKVWIAFILKKFKERDKLLCEYKMKCIWTGDLREVWDTVQLCRIIENVHYWIINHFRPWVSSCLDGWRLADNKNSDTIDDEVENSTDKYEELKNDRALEADQTADRDDDVDSNRESRSENSSLYGVVTSIEYDDEDEDEDGDEYEDEDEEQAKGCQAQRRNSPPDRKAFVQPQGSAAPRIKSSRGAKDRNARMSMEELVGPKASQPFSRYPLRSRNAATLSPELPSRSRAVLHHGETSTFSLAIPSAKKHVRSLSAGHEYGALSRSS